MSTSSVPSVGYYSIIQFVPDPEKSEGANIGVALLCGRERYFRARFAGSNQRIRRFFGSDMDIDLGRVNLLKVAFEERVAAAANEVHTREQFEAFIGSRANQLLLTPPRPIKISDPDADLSELFDQLIGGQPTTARRTQRTERELEERFVGLLKRRNIEDRVERDVEIDWPLAGRRLHFPFAFRNGALNVIQAVSFERSANANFRRACELAIEGEDLRQLDEQPRLAVLGRFGEEPNGSAKQVRALLDSREVTLHLPHELDLLADEIERAAD